MATQTKSRNGTDNPRLEQTYDETVERIRDLNERILESGKKAGTVYLDAYEKSLSSIADFQDRVADASQIEWVSAVANAQANFTREIAKSYSAAGRDLLK
jgi:hypothetical protein